MPPDRLVAILARLGEDPDGVGPSCRLCEVAAVVTAVTGAGIMLSIGEAAEGTLCTTGSVSELIEDLQYMLGEGPCVDAHRSGAAVAEPDLAAPRTSRWPAFGPPALAAGARAVFGFPLQVGAARLGALNLYRERPGPLSDEQHATALVMADVAARTILTMQAAAAAGEIAVEVEADANFNLVVHQAAGMVSVQLGIAVVDALIRLRSHAFATERLVGDVAAEVVSRQLRFDHNDRR